MSNIFWVNFGLDLVNKQIDQKCFGQMGGFIIVVLIKCTISGHHKVFDGSAANFGQQSIHAIQPT